MRHYRVQAELYWLKGTLYPYLKTRFIIEHMVLELLEHMFEIIYDIGQSVYHLLVCMIINFFFIKAQN